MTLLPNYQAEIRPEETGDPRRPYAALKRQGFTHLFGRPDDFAGLDDAQILVYANPASRLGSTRSFREPSTEPTAIFAIKEPNWTVGAVCDRATSHVALECRRP